MKKIHGAIYQLYEGRMAAQLPAGYRLVTKSYISKRQKFSSDIRAEIQEETAPLGRFLTAGKLERLRQTLIREREVEVHTRR